MFTMIRDNRCAREAFLLARVAWLEPFWILLAGILVVFPATFISQRYHPYVLFSLFLFWPLRWVIYGRLSRRSPLDWGIAFFVALVASEPVGFGRSNNLMDLGRLFSLWAHALHGADQLATGATPTPILWPGFCSSLAAVSQCFPRLLRTGNPSSASLTCQSTTACKHYPSIWARPSMPIFWPAPWS